MNNTELNQIFKKLDKWVSVHGTGNYVHKNFFENPDDNYNLSENFGIQQVRQEIFNFSKEILEFLKNELSFYNNKLYGDKLYKFQNIIKKDYKISRMKFQNHIGKAFLLSIKL